MAERDRLRPAWRFAPARNWINDPNGLVRYEGEHHLFFQYNPLGAQWGHMSWGHAVSTDLIHWRELPLAIPETEVMAFSGSVVVDAENTSGLGGPGRPALVALYTGHDAASGHEAQHLAFSLDAGRSWMLRGCVLDIGAQDFRDPKVFWHGPTRAWVMVVALAAERRIAVYRSDDLLGWTLASQFGPAGAPGRNWECPDLFELPVEGAAAAESRWVMVVNIGAGAAAGGSGGQYFVGGFDGWRFSLDPDQGAAPAWIDHGSDFYAVASWSGVPAEDGRRIWVAWASDWRYAHKAPTGRWRGMMSTPREVSLARVGEGWRLRQAPVRELERLRARHGEARDLVLGEAPLALDGFGVAGAALDLSLEIDAGSAGEVAVVAEDGRGLRLEIGVDAKSGEAFIDRTRPGRRIHEAFPARHTAPLAPGAGPASLRVLVDHSLVEVFADGGLACLTDQVFPRGPLTWSLVTRGGAARLVRLEAWTMEA